MARLRALLRAVSLWGSIKRIVPEVGRLGIGFALAAALSLVFASVAQAQTDSGESGVPRLTIARSHASVVKGEEATFTITASSAPSADLDVYVQVQVTVRERSLYQSKVIVVSMAAGERTIEFIAGTGGSEVGEGTLTLDVSILGGSGYRLGETQVAGIRVTDPPPAAGTRQGVPAAPSGFTASAVAEDSIAVSWTGVAGVSRYRLEKQLGSLGIVMWRVVGGLDSIAQTSATVAGLRSGTQYQYRVRAYNAAGWGVPSSSASATTQGVQGQTTDLVGVRAAPPTPGGFSASAPNHFTIKASWNAVTGANCYRFGVWIHTIGYPAGWHYKNTPATSYTWTGGIDRGTTYDIRVAAANVDDCPPDETISAEWSADSWLKVTTPRPDPPAPSGFSGSATGTHSISASWDRVVGASKYEFGIKTGTPGSWKSKEVSSPATSTTWSTGLAPNTTYEIRVRAHGDRHWLAFVWGPYSEAEVTTDETSTPPPPPPPPPPSKLATPKVDIVPLPQRKVRLQWQAVTGASGYTVQIQKRGGNWSSPSPREETQGANETSYDINLMDIYGGEGLAHDTNGFEFRVMAKHSDSNRNSAYSADIIVRDSPSVTVNGHSSNRNTAVVKWKAPRNAKEYFVRWRVLGDDASGNAYTSPGWHLDASSLPASTFAPTTATPSPTSLTLTAPTTIEHTISGLTPGALHAVQVVYRIDDGWVFSGRDAYVWTSKNKPAPLTRVAGYPFYGHFANKTYAYRICKSTFGTDSNTWALMIEHALMQWQKATNGLISMVPEHDTSNPNHRPTSPEYKPCTQYSSFFDVFLYTFDDRERSEIRMINPPNNAPYPWAFYVYEIAADLLKHCLVNSIACVTAPGLIGKPIEASTEFQSADITFNFDEVEEKKLSPAVPSDVVFNSCVINANPQPNDIRQLPNKTWTSDQYAAYAVTVHEGGHALGIGGIEIDLATFTVLARGAHPSTGDAVLNYTWSEPDCAPHPLDIMAIHALYQSP